MRAKKLNTNTVVKESSQKLRWLDYQCILTGDMRPMNENGFERLAIEIVQWASNDDEALKITQFMFVRGINDRVWRQWCEKSPRLKEATELAKRIIGNRREVGALKNKLNTSVVAFTMPFYDDEWKDETIRRAALKEGSSGDGKDSITVVLNPIPNSEIVLQRNTKDEEQK